MRKFSHQRELILNYLKDVNCHPTAADVYDAVKKEQPSISLATVYRNLNLLRDMGEIISFKTGNGSEHFDGNTSHHMHFCCNECGDIYDIFMEYDASSAQNVENLLDCKVSSSQILFYGSCINCLNN